MKLNLGCGGDRRDGWLNVDAWPGCAPDLVHDLEALPWPWADDTADEILMSHVLEHLGRDRAVYVGIVKEVHRVLRPGGLWTVTVPHPRHDFFLWDPTHVRPVTPEGLAMFDQRRNLEDRRRGAANSPLGLMHGVDFRIEAMTHDLDAAWQARLRAGTTTMAEVQAAARSQFNVIEQTTVRLRAMKPPRGA
ncbi:MAG: class I SAM-dependent methyltransferase [Rhodospirillales bacterium]|jgi:SAM-dependent methyltransferase